MKLSTLKKLTRCTEKYLREGDIYPEVLRRIDVMEIYHPGHSQRWYILAAINDLGPDL